MTANKLMRGKRVYQGGYEDDQSIAGELLTIAGGAMFLFGLVWALGTAIAPSLDTPFEVGCGRRLKKGQRPLNFHRGRPRIRVKFYQKRDPRDRILHVSWAYLNLFTVFHADTSHGRRFLQVLHGQFLCFALIFPRSPQNSCRFDPIYYQELGAPRFYDWLTGVSAHDTPLSHVARFMKEIA